MSGRPNLPEVIGSGVTVNGQPYLVTKLYERGTLLRRVQRGGALSPGEVASAGRQLAMALETLHQNSILHGDVKPENVFIDDDGSMVLGDLGSAWLRADGGPAAAMTPPYAAPEVWLGHAPTVASDLYSLGLTLMFAASARVPMAGSPPREDEVVEAFGSDLALAAVADRPPPPPPHRGGRRPHPRCRCPRVRPGRLRRPDPAHPDGDPPAALMPYQTHGLRQGRQETTASARLFGFGAGCCTRSAVFGCDATDLLIERGECPGGLKRGESVG